MNGQDEQPPKPLTREAADAQLRQGLAKQREFNAWVAARRVRTLRRESEDGYLGFRVVFYLQSNLMRARAMSDGLSTAIRAGNYPLACLAMRAYLECLGGISYLSEKCDAHYRGRQDVNLWDTTYRLILGSRSDPEAPESINVMTQVGYIDRAAARSLGERSNEKNRDAQDTYNYLSERCHPNLIALAHGSRGESIALAAGIEPSTDDYPGLCTFYCLAALQYMFIFDDLMRTVAAHEIMPKSEILEYEI